MTDVIYVEYVNFSRVNLDFGEVTSSFSPPLVNKCNLCASVKIPIWSAHLKRASLYSVQYTPLPPFQNHLFLLLSFLLVSSFFFFLPLCHLNTSLSPSPYSSFFGTITSPSLFLLCTSSSLYHLVSSLHPPAPPPPTSPILLFSNIYL